MRTLRWPLAIVLSGLLLSSLVLAEVDSPVRVAVTLWFLLVCTGMSFVPLLPIASPPARIALVVALSLAIDTVVATVLLVAGDFTMTAGLFTLEAICLAGCALQAWSWARVRPAAEVRLHVQP